MTTKCLNKPAPLESVNARVLSTFQVGKLTGTFDGTTLDLVRRATLLGATAGAEILANYGGRSLSLEDTIRMVLIAAPHDPRAAGLWAERCW
jgi:hypothetical protein